VEFRDRIAFTLRSDSASSKRYPEPDDVRLSTNPLMDWSSVKVPAF
jgi:hypothetical protein